MKNMTVNPIMSAPHSERVLASWVMVLLKEMYLKSFTTEKKTQRATNDLNISEAFPRVL